jgi:hypothetical protein
MVHRGCPSNTYGPSLWVRFEGSAPAKLLKAGPTNLRRGTSSTPWIPDTT